MQVAGIFCLLVLGASTRMCVAAEEHHTRHSLPKLLSPCPVSCQCFIDNHYTETVDITCRNRSGLGIKLPPSVTRLNYFNVSTMFLQSSNIVPTSSSGSDMVDIVYKQSGIKSVSQLAFTKVPFLELLDLSSNLIETLPPTVFQPLVRLRVLILTDNKLQSLPSELFENQQYLTKLYLSKNNLESTYSETYSNCTAIQILDLSYNKINKLEEKIFNPSLEVLFLNDNRLKDIPIKPFSELNKLEILNLANNDIHLLSDDLFRRLIALNKLDIQGNRIASLPKHIFKGLSNLEVLNLSKNPITFLDDELFQTNLDLNTLVLRETHLTLISARLLGKLKRLRVFNASHNYHLQTIEDFKFSSSNHLQYIDLSFSNLTHLPIFISHLEMVEQLQLDGNQWKCDCKSGWFMTWLYNHQHLNNTINNALQCDGQDMTTTLEALNCEPPTSGNDTIHEVLEFRSTVVLTCSFSGEPAPSITWVTPSGYVFHYYPRTNSTDIFSSHPRIHLYNLDPVEDSRVRVMSNGSLEIIELLRQDAGIYTCLALNPVGNSTSHIVVTLDRKTFFHIKIMCIIVGASSVIAVVLCTALGQFIYWLCKKCGIVEERSKQLMQLRENIESYKTQQLKSLRENYTQQVHKIKQNCALQVEWIRESYQGQVKHIRDFKHYGSHQFTSMRDQYYDQMRKVRDYSTTQLGWVRENYVFQRDRVQKFSSHQVLRFRESYKYQQQTLNKILDNIPSLDNCRSSSCGRSETSVCDQNKEEVDIDVHGFEAFVKSKVEEMTDPSILDEKLDDQSVYYTPSELSESPLSPTKELFRKQDFTLHPGAYDPNIDPLDCPGTSYSTVPWQTNSPVCVFSSSQCPLTKNEFYVPRTLQSSTSLPEMPQSSYEVRPVSLETTL